MFFRSKQHKNRQRAFGLIELMVSISIMAIVSAVIVTRQSAFNGAVLLRNQAYEVAFALREAQLLAVSGGDDVRTYGVFFDTSNATERKLYRIFKDMDNDSILDSGEQIGLTGRLDSRFEIRGLIPNYNNTLTVMFTRPNFDARFCAQAGGCTTSPGFTPGPSYIDVARVGVATNGVGDVRRVQISDTGQISVVTY